MFFAYIRVDEHVPASQHCWYVASVPKSDADGGTVWSLKDNDDSYTLYFQSELQDRKSSTSLARRNVSMLFGGTNVTADITHARTSLRKTQVPDSS